MKFDLIREFPNNLSKDFCDHLIEKFEKVPNKYPGTIGHKVVDKSIKDSIDYSFSQQEEWAIENDYIHNKLFEVSIPYMKEHHELLGYPWPNGVISDSGFQIQRTPSDSIGYIWHSDEAYHFCDETRRVQRRSLTYLWYLNDCEEGYTEFLDRKIKPECGKLILFFADPSMLHRGIPPKTGFKYIMTGWIRIQIDVMGIKDIIGFGD